MVATRVSDVNWNRPLDCWSTLVEEEPRTTRRRVARFVRQLLVGVGFRANHRRFPIRTTTKPRIIVRLYIWGCVFLLDSNKTQALSTHILVSAFKTVGYALRYEFNNLFQKACYMRYELFFTTSPCFRNSYNRLWPMRDSNFAYLPPDDKTMGRLHHDRNTESRRYIYINKAAIYPAYE